MTISEIFALFQPTNGVSIDSRNVPNGALFFAIKGERFDGNQFVEQALANGAAFAILDDPTMVINESCILVDDTLLALQQLARMYRDSFSIPVIGLTGSNGKTTNKELLTAVLAQKFKVHATAGNLNNHLGVPLTLLAMPKDTEIAVIEMGANHQQEIADLCAICAPTHGFLTNIGKAHLEGFGGIEGVQKGKGELFDFLKNNQGTTFINSDLLRISNMAEERQLANVITYNKQTCPLQLLEHNPLIRFQLENTVYTSPIGGSYNFDNMLTAFTIGTYFGVSKVQAAQALAAYQPKNHRSQIIERGTNSILMDAYNANPSSMQAAISHFLQIETPKKKALILGDMFELGEDSPKEHAEIGRQLKGANVEWIVLYGENMQHALPYLPKAYYFTDKFSLHNWLIDKNLDNHFILVKGSRGVGLESILTVLPTSER